MLTIAYLPALKGGFIWDDDAYVTQNPLLRTSHGLWRIWFEPGVTQQYYPLVHTTFWLEYHCWDLNPLGYHLVNLLLHGIAAFLLFRLLTRLRIPGAWLAAAIFALHPVEVESVAWVTELKNVLSGVFYLAAALAWLRFDPFDGSQATNDRRRWAYYVFALLLFICAMLSKTVACSFPAAMLIVRWWKTGRLRAKDFLPLAPFFLLGALGGWWTSYLEKHHVGAEGADWSLNLPQRVIIAGKALWFYVMKLAWPARLTFSYPRWEINPAQWWQWLFPLAFCALLAALWFNRNRMGRGPLAAVLFFAGTLVPALGFVNVFPMRFTFVADHYQYFACIGIIALCSALLIRLPRLAILALLLVLAGRTWQQGHIYKNVKTLWSDTLAKNPESWLAHDNLGVALYSEGDLEGAMEQFKIAVRLNPKDPVAINDVGNMLSTGGDLEGAIKCFQKAISLRPQYGRAYLGMGTALTKQGRDDEAIVYYRKAAELYPEDAEVQHKTGNALLKKGHYQEANSYFEAALRLQPESAEIHSDFGLSLSREGKLDAAIGEYEQSLKLEPSSAIAHGYLGSLLLRKGDLEGAIGHLRRSVELDSKNVFTRTQLGLALGKKGNLDEALSQFQKAVQLDPEDAFTRNFFGVTLGNKGKLDDAIQEFKEAIRLKPDFAEAHVHYGTALAAQGKIEEAAAEYKTALKLYPDYEEAKKRLQALSTLPAN